MYQPNKWQDFQLLDAGDGEKLERWGKEVLVRPDPQAIWPHAVWKDISASYSRSTEGGGQWHKKKKMPASWVITYPSLAGELRFTITLMGFKHTGLFPEQAANWDFMQEQIIHAKESGRREPIRILNLFAYTGGATLACAKAGADEVVHVDASKKIIQMAKENVQLSSLQDAYIRFIAEDVNRFVDRERRRGRKYDGILMDPPAYGRGPTGELWKLESAVFPLVEKCAALLSEKPLFFLMNAYTTGLTAGALSSILKLGITLQHGGKVEADELVLPAQNRPIYLPCGCTGRWTP